MDVPYRTESEYREAREAARYLEDLAARAKKQVGTSGTAPAQRSAEEQLRQANREIARLKEAARKARRKSGGGSSEGAFPGAHRGY